MGAQRQDISGPTLHPCGTDSKPDFPNQDQCNACSLTLARGGRHDRGVARLARGPAEARMRPSSTPASSRICTSSEPSPSCSGCLSVPPRSSSMSLPYRGPNRCRAASVEGFSDERQKPSSSAVSLLSRRPGSDLRARTAAGSLGRCCFRSGEALSCACKHRVAVRAAASARNRILSGGTPRPTAPAHLAIRLLVLLHVLDAQSDCCLQHILIPLGGWVRRG